MNFIGVKDKENPVFVDITGKLNDIELFREEGKEGSVIKKAEYKINKIIELAEFEVGLRDKFSCILADIRDQVFRVMIEDSGRELICSDDDFFSVNIVSLHHEYSKKFAAREENACLDFICSVLKQIYQVK